MWKRVMSLILTLTMVVGMMSSMGTVVEAAGTGITDDPIVVYRNPKTDYAPSELNGNMNEISTVINVLNSFEVRNETKKEWVSLIKAGANVEGEVDILFEMNGEEISLCNDTTVETDFGEQSVPLYKLFGWRAVNGGTATEKVKIVDANGNILEKVVEIKNHVDVTWNYSNGSSDMEVLLGTAIKNHSNYSDIQEKAKNNNVSEGKDFAGWDIDQNDSVDDSAFINLVNNVIDVKNVAEFEGKTFTAIYAENVVEKIDTRIVVEDTEVSIPYSTDLTLQTLISKVGATVVDEHNNKVTDLSFTCPISVGPHSITLAYAGDETYKAADDVIITITITSNHNVEDPVVVYRNPKLDKAGKELTLESLMNNEFSARDDSTKNWLSKVQTVTGCEKANDMQFQVKVAGAETYVNVVNKTSYNGESAQLGGLFGWKAVRDGKAGDAVTENVRLVDVEGNVLAENIPVTVKGYVDVTWHINDQEEKTQHELGSAICESDEFKRIEKQAGDAASQGKFFAGWKNKEGNMVISDLMKVIDVIEKDGTVLAEKLDNEEFTAVYQENKVLDTYIDVDNDLVEITYSDDLTEEKILKKIKPVVMAMDEEDNASKIDDAEVDFECSTGIGTHRVTIRYNGKDSQYWPSSREVTVVIKGKEVHDTIVVYRNPVQDCAPKFEDLEPSINMLSKFIVRPETKASWLDEAVNVADANNASDLQVNVTEYIEKIKDKLEEVLGSVDLDIEYVNVREKTEFLGNPLDLGNLFGSQAVQGGIAEAVTEENVRIVDANNKVIQDGLTFQIKGYVDVNWQYQVDGNVQTLKSQIPLNSAIGLYATDGVTTEYDKAKKAANDAVASTGLVFDRWEVDGWDVNGWDVDEDGEIDNDDIAALLITTIDVFAKDGTVSAKAVEGMTFKAVYKEGQQGPVVEKLATKIIPSKTNVTLTYSSELTEEAILNVIAPVVKDSNENVIGDAKDVLISCDVAAGTQTATLSYQGDLDNYKPAKDVTVTVIINKAKPVMSVSSYTLEYGKTVTEEQVYSANCDTIKFLAGLDVHDPENMISKVQLALPENLMTIVGIGVGALGQEIDLKNLTIQQLQEIIGKAEEAGTSLGSFTQYLGYLDQMEAFLQKLDAEYGVSIDLTISISDTIVMPTAVGVYAAGMMGSDSNYESDMAAGYILITPAMTQTTLSWNATDDNFVIGLDKTAYFDFTANAKNAVVNSKIEYLFIGVDSNQEFVLNRVNPAKEDVSKALNAVGVYAQIAYVADFGNEMFYANPIVRPILVSPEIADVKFVSTNGDESLAEVFEYGDKISFDVTVDGKKNPKGTLYVKYAGSDITANGWYRDEVPSEPGMYTAVAVYGEKNAAGEIVKLGGAVKVFVIEKADADLSMSNVTVKPDGKEHFTEISNKDMTYVTVALDETENVYINIPSDIEEKLESAVKKLPVKAEALVSEFLEDHVYCYIGKKEEVDGDDYKKALEVTIQKLINLDLSGEAKAEMDALYEAVADEIAKYDIQSTIKEKIEAEANKLNNYVTGVTPDILDEPLKKVMEAAIVIDGTDVYLDRAAAEAALKAIIEEFGDPNSFDIGSMSTEELMTVAGIGAAAVVVDKILAQNEGLDFIEVKVEEIKAELKEIKLYDPKKLAKQVIDALDGYLDEEELAKVYNQFFTALDESGYVTELVTIIEGLAEMCDADTSTAVNAINSGLDRLLKTLAGKTKNGTLTKEDFKRIEEYIDDVLTELMCLVEDLPDGTYYFGTNPSKIGVYNCYAINLSKHYKSEVLDAVLNIQEDEVVRVYGQDRYLTSMAICDELKEKKGVDKFDTMILATGDKFADAMSATYLSYVADAPILLIDQYHAEKVAEYLNKSLKRGGKVYVIGGEAAIAESWLEAIDTTNVERLYGKDRYLTNLAVINAAIPEGGRLDEILICSGESFADNISASAAKRPILLVNGNEPTQEQKEFLQTLSGNVEFYVIGGDAAVEEAMEESLKKYGTVVDRVYGTGRCETSYAVATELVPEADSLLITYAYEFPDGICGGLLATTTNAAIILVNPEDASMAKKYVAEKNISAGYILGGDRWMIDDLVADIYNISENEIIQKKYQ